MVITKLSFARTATVGPIPAWCARHAPGAAGTGRPVLGLLLRDLGLKDPKRPCYFGCLKGPEGILLKGCRGRCRYRWVFWLLKRGFKVSSGIVEWYRGSYGTDRDNSEIASPVLQ